MDRRTFLLSALAASVVGSPAAQAQPNWIRLGSRPLRWRTDRESIRVFLTGPIAELQFRTRSEVFINAVEIFFDRGSRERHVLNRVVTRLRPVDVGVRNRGRDIRRVEFGFRHPGHLRPATSAVIELYGRR